MDCIIRPYCPEDKNKIAALIGRVYGENAKGYYLKIFDWLFTNNPYNPDNRCHIYVAEDEHKIVGIMANNYVFLKILSSLKIARWGNFFFVDRDHKGLGIELFLSTLTLGVYPFFAFPNNPATLFEITMGMVKIGKIKTKISILNIKNVIVKKVRSGFALNPAKGIISKESYSRGKSKKNYKHFQIREISYFDGKFNGFWEEVSREYPLIVVRDQKYLNWRFIDCPIKYKILVAFSANDDIRGYVILRLIKGIIFKKGFIVDILANPRDYNVIGALMAESVLYFKEQGCDIAESMIVTNKRPYHRALIRNGFIINGSMGNFLCYSPDEKELSFMKSIDNWFITPSDPDLEITSLIER